MYAYEGAFTKEETQAWLNKNLDRYKNDGMGLWAVVLKKTGKMIGQCGLTWQDVDGEQVVEVGYLFNREFWHMGFATESARACKDFAFKVKGFKEVFTIVRDINIASMNVAIRNSMQIRKRFVKVYKGIEMPHFAFCARNWFA
jgi:RimJ/RimL family protein N-acetyltransferase